MQYACHMKMLKELIDLLPPEKIAQIELIGSKSNSDTQLEKLYRGLQKREFSSEEEAIEKLYGSQKNSGATFAKLRERLRDRLLNTLFFVDVNKPKFSEHPLAVVNCHQQYAQFKILLVKSARKTGIWLAEGLLEYTQKYELTELTYLITTDLKYHYGTLEINKPKYLKFDSIQKKSLEQLQDENLAMDGYHLFFLKDMGKNKTSLADINNQWLTMDAVLKEKFTHEATSRFLHYYSNAYAEYQFLNGDYPAIIPVIQKSIKYLYAKKNLHKPIAFSMYRILLMAHFNLRQLKEAIEISNSIENLTVENQHNWFVIRYFKALFYIHKREYESAEQIKVSTFKTREIDDLKSGLFEIWRTLEAYLEFLAVYREGTSKKNREGSFRLNKFLNQVPLYQKDKTRRNVTILLVQLLFFLARNNYGRYIDRMDALTQYRQRYLKENNTFRSNCMIRMMVKVGKYGFHPKRVKSYTKKDLWKLKSRQAELSSRSSEVEIIPYEDMWDMVMDMLERNYEKTYFE